MCVATGDSGADKALLFYLSIELRDGNGKVFSTKKRNGAKTFLVAPVATSDHYPRLLGTTICGTLSRLGKRS